MKKYFVLTKESEEEGKFQGFPNVKHFFLLKKFSAEEEAKAYALNHLPSMFGEVTASPENSLGNIILVAKYNGYFTEDAGGGESGDSVISYAMIHLERGVDIAAVMKKIRTEDFESAFIGIEGRLMID